MAQRGISPHEEKMVKLQYQLRENQQELHDILSDLGNWEDQMKVKEEDLNKSKKPSDQQELPPIRNSLDRKKFKKKKKKSEPSKKPTRIRGSDFRSWDKYDVEKALQEIDQSEEKKSSSEYETDEEWEMERRKHLANEEKDKGNSHMNAGAYDAAIECYTRGIQLDPANALLPANRAMALLKLQKFGAAELDCHTAIVLDPLYVKAYLRRGAARTGLKKLPEALEDFRRVLQLEPSNKQARLEVEQLEKELARDNDQLPPVTSLDKPASCEVKPIYKAPEERSKKPLRRMEIQEIGMESKTHQKEAIARVVASQSSAKKEMEAKDNKMFEHLVGHCAGDGADKTKTTSMSLDNTVSACTTVCDNHVANHHQTVTSGSVLESSDFNSAITGASVNKSDSSKRRRHCDELKPTSLQVHTSSSVTSILERELPQTSFQFQADFKVLKNNLLAFYSYFKKIDPDQYPKLFGQSLEAAVLLKIVDAIREHFIPNGEDFYHQLKGLSEVKRFSMTVMFLSSKEKQGLREIFHHLRTTDKYCTTDIEALAKKYDI